VNVKNAVTKWLLEALNVPPATLEIKPRVNQKSLVSRPAIGFIISRAPPFRNPYLTKVTNQLGSTHRQHSKPIERKLLCIFPIFLETHPPQAVRGRCRFIKIKIAETYAKI
jgi:hypothetical protein